MKEAINSLITIKIFETIQMKATANIAYKDN
jgi:hypothetical protein